MKTKELKNKKVDLRKKFDKIPKKFRRHSKYLDISLKFYR